MLPLARPFDTSPDAHAVQHDIYGRMGGAGRVATAFRLSAAARAMTLAGIQSRHPEYTDDEVRRALARLTLGDDLARRVWPGQPLIDP